MYSYNYVLFNASDNLNYVDHTAYYTICVEDLYNNPNVIVVSYPLDYVKNKFAYKVYRLHTSRKVAQKIRLPFKSLWYPFYFRDIFKNKKPYCFIFINREYPLDYYKYLKDHYPNCKIVLLHRDLLKVCNSMSPELAHNKYLDLEMSFDIDESKKYNMVHFDEFESKINIAISNSYPESDLFFAGKAKERLPLLLDIYEKLNSNGLNVKYFLTGVSKDKQIHREGIEYSDKFMSYEEMLYHSVNSRCILEINQADADGYTSRFLESVMYNKKLITNNSYVQNSKFYNNRFINIFNSASEIDCDFLLQDESVNFHYNNEFSPEGLVLKIDNILTSR